ncbi:hypothetical protein [Sediminispirochaeta bajacaliforniensis]|uniref:hypothetical protein n=1 Tax=Sediminispirochaeta bajacaliforniensis TaxID=148 RepID=UPI0003A5A210|nr:hypothetical protein [Sediminispirochaeta bajacaliforniensis]
MNKFRFMAGVLLIPAFVFQQSLFFRIIQVVLLIVYSLLLGRRFRFLPNIALLLGVTAANLLTPVGEVLFRIGTFPVTSVALVQGLMRALLFIGLVYLSRSSISASLALPGKGGALVARTLYYFEKIIDFDPPAKEKGFWYALTHLGKRLDQILLFCFEEADESPADPLAGKRREAAVPLIGIRIYIVVLILLFWTLFVISQVVKA